MILTREKAREAARTLLDRWRDDPVTFAREALGVVRMWWRQEELLRAAATHRKVAVRSGQKTSKTFTIAILALWWALTRPKSRVVIVAPSARQIRINVWGELANIRADSYDRTTLNADGSPRVRAVLPLGGEWHESPETGWKFPNRSQIVGFVSNDPERLRGLSGADQLYIIDEASGVPDEIFASIDGNLAGGGRIIAISNPVHDLGWYAQTFAEGSRWHAIAISSIEASEVSPPIPGLATKEFIEEKRHEWGVESAEWYAKILGKFPPASVDGVIPKGLALDATKRWTTTPQTDDPLELGVDVARFGNDKSSIVWRRGSWASAPRMLKGCDVVEVAETTLAIIREVARPGERVKAKIDAVSVGGGVADILRRHPRVELADGGFCELEVVDVQAAASSPDPSCARMRDAMWLSLRKWLTPADKAGADGAIPRDLALLADITAPRVGYDATNRWKVESKFDVRKRIGRSTDCGDALALAVFDVETDVGNAGTVLSDEFDHMPRAVM